MVIDVLQTQVKKGIEILSDAESALRHYKNGNKVFYYDPKKENVYEVGSVGCHRDVIAAMDDLDNALIIFARVKEG